jgi:hypothetical protein
MEMNEQIIEQGFERVWKLFQETDRKFQETDRKFEKTERELQELRFTIREMSQETDRRFQETDRKFKETDRKFQETDRRFQETDRKFQETDRKFQETMQRLSERIEKTSQTVTRVSNDLGRLGNRLGEFVEYLIKPSLVKLFQARGLEVYKVLRDIEANNPKLGLAMQVDLLVINSDTCILIEVKSHLSIEDINTHIKRMEKFKPLFPEYKNSQVLGAVAGMVMPDDVAKYGYKKGFFVIGQKGEIAVILNDEQFKPAIW